ncbi:MAG: ATP-binding protein [Thermoleophilia bacterium]|nr:ATP-binding protein [Thermoleophilia bacterium]
MEGQLRTVIRQKIIDAEKAPIPDFTRRDLHVPVIPNKALAVIGMRRTGKTTFLWQVLADRLASGTPREGVLFFSFDDERLADLTASDLGILLEEYYLLHPEWRDDRRALLLLDEIQLVPGWERFARRVLDTENVDLFVAGSSARMLSREVASSMRGRAMEVVVFPFSFREFLRHRGREVEDPERIEKARRSALRADLETYLTVGGFPEAQGASERDRAELLRTYVDVTVLRDVIERYEVSHPVALRQLTRHLLGHAARLFSVNRFYNDLRSRGVRVAKDSLHEYLAYLEDAFLVYGVWLATESERRRMSNPRKFYPVDPGLIPLYDRSGRMQLSKALETVVLIELLRRGAKVGYVRNRDGSEVDFLARWPGGRRELVQVCAEVSDAATLEREVRALLNAAPDYPGALLTLITLLPEAVRNVPAQIRVQDASVWLLRSAEASGETGDTASGETGNTG